MKKIVLTIHIHAGWQGEPSSSVDIPAIDVSGYAVHRKYNSFGGGGEWTVSHIPSGHHLGVDFKLRLQAIRFAQDMAAHYNGSLAAKAFTVAVQDRGLKPSLLDLAKKHSAI